MLSGLAGPSWEMLTSDRLREGGEGGEGGGT